MKIKIFETMAIVTILVAFALFVNSQINIPENQPTIIQRYIDYVGSK